MAVNELTFWQDGFPEQGADNGLSVNEFTFWQDGFPYNLYFPQAAPGGATLKTWNGMALADIKTFNGIAIASVKTINGLTTV